MISQKIPQLSGSIPVIGHSLQLLRDPARFMASLPTNEELVQIRIGPKRAIMVLEHKLTSQVLRDDRVFDKGGIFYDRLREVLGDGVGTCPRSEHRRQRRIIQPAFNADQIPNYTRTITEHIGTITEAWTDGQIIDVREEMLKISARIAAATMFSDSIPSHAFDQLTGNFTQIIKTMYKRMVTPPPLGRLPTPDKRRYNKARAHLQEMGSRLIAERRLSGEAHEDLLSVLLTACNEAGQGLSEVEVHDNLRTFLVTGATSAATAMSWMLHLLAQHPDVQSRLKTEVDTVLGAATPTFADLSRLDLTRRIVTESLRLWPTGWFLTRVATADIHLGGYPVPAGTTIVFSPYFMHRRPDTYSDPDVFDPDRWLPERVAVPRTAYLPFGEGARKCIGDSFSLAQARLVIVGIASKWHLEPAPCSEVRPFFGGILSPRGLRLRVTARAHV